MSRALRDAFGQFATGCTVITTQDKQQDVGLTCSSFNTVSLEPPMVLWSLRKAANCLESFMDNDDFAVSVLSVEQSGVAWAFSKGEQAERFASAGITRLPSGLAVIDGAIAWFGCQVTQRVDAGDHIVLIGEVNQVETHFGDALVFAKSQFCRLVALEDSRT